MGDFSKSTVTLSGEALENKAKQLQKAIKFDRVVTGDGWLKEGQDLASLTELIHDVQDYKLGSANILVNNQATLRFTIDSSQVKQTYQLREVGVMAHIEDDPTTLTLFCVANAGDTADTIVPSHDGSSATRDQYTIVLKASRKVKMTAKIVIEDQVPLHAATHLGNGVDPIPTVSSERTGLVPVGLNDPKLVLVSSDPPHWGPVPLADRINIGGILPLNGQAKSYLAGDGRWHRMTPFIMGDTTLYVDPSNNDSPPKFSTLAKALEYLNDYQIFTGVTVTVEIADGKHRIEDTIKFDHPQTQQVRIVGASQRQQIGFSDLTVSGDDLILKASSAKGLKVGMSVIIDGTDLQGGCKGGHTVLGIQGSSVRVSGSNINNRLITNQSNLKTSSMFFYRTKVHCTKGGLYLDNGLGPSGRLDMSGSWPISGDVHHGIISDGKSVFSDLIVSGFHSGIYSNHRSNLNFVAVHNCSDGVLVDIASAGNLYCNGNSNVGLWAYQSNMYIGTFGSGTRSNSV